MSKTMSSTILLKRFIPYYKPYYRVLALDLACAALTSACEIALPLIVRAVTDRAIADAAAVTAVWVLRLALLYLALRVMDAGANFFMESQGHIMGAGIETNMRTDLFDHLQQLSFSYYYRIHDMN
jgi:ATP-binding cassette, subfamily B, bacterial